VKFRTQLAVTPNLIVQDSSAKRTEYRAGFSQWDLSIFKNFTGVDTTARFDAVGKPTKGRSSARIEYPTRAGDRGHLPEARRGHRAVRRRELRVVDQIDAGTQPERLSY
jgi:hypothetical protein